MMDALLNHIHLCAPTCRYTTVLPAAFINPLSYLSSQPSGPPKRPLNGYMKYVLKQQPIISTQFPGMCTTHCQSILQCSLLCEYHIATSSSRYKVHRHHQEDRPAVENNEPRWKAGIPVIHFFFFFLFFLAQIGFSAVKEAVAVHHWHSSVVCHFWLRLLGCVHLPPMSAISRGVFARQGEVQDWFPAVPGPAQPCSSAAASPGEEAEVGQKEGHPQKKSMQGIRHPDTNTNTQPAVWSLAQVKHLESCWSA